MAEEKKKEDRVTVVDGEPLRDSERTPCEVWTRVMGYHRPISSFNIGKKGEAAERVCFSEHPCGCNRH